VDRSVFKKLAQVFLHQFFNPFVDVAVRWLGIFKKR
jgi:hypothetical protein